jgi:HEAT repeat protein
LSAFTALIAIGPEAKDVPLLDESLKAADPELRRLAADALAKLGPQAKPAVPALLANLKSKDKGMRLVAMRALEAIGTEAKEAVPLLTEAMQDSDLEVAIPAAVALAKVSGDAKEPLALLRKAVQSKTNSGSLKKRAVQGLAALNAQDLPSAKALLSALTDDQARPDAKMALVKIGKGAADIIALALVKDFKTSEAARLACIEMLGDLGHKSLYVGQALTAVVRGDTDANKKAAIRVWEKLTGQKVNTSGGTVGPGGPGGGIGPGR